MPILRALAHLRRWFNYRTMPYRGIVQEAERHRARQAELLGYTTSSDQRNDPW